MFNIILFEPEIPQNTGNIIRLCANTGAALHLIKPLGFSPTDAKLKRAGLDYHDWAKVLVHDDLTACMYSLPDPKRLFICETSGRHLYSDMAFQAGDSFLFGPESRGLPLSLLQSLSQNQSIYLPMLTCERSLNLSNAVAVVIYEAWRQIGFRDAIPQH